MNETIKSINNPILVEEPADAPKMVFFMLKRPVKQGDQIDIDILSYVGMAGLSKPLQDAIRQELGLNSK